MVRATDMAGALYLRLGPVLARLRRVPVLGRALHWLSYRLLPAEEAIWMQVSAGAGAGLWLKLYPRFDRLLWSGTLEPEVQAALAECIQPGSVVYDVGANMGFYSLVVARLAGPQGRVYAFEPEPLNFQRLEEHIARNALYNIHTTCAAVAAESGMVRFRRGDPRLSPTLLTGQLLTAGQPGLPQGVRDAPAEHAVEMPAVALDEFVSEHPPPHLIKCDVEGAEMEVLRGAAELLIE